MLPASKIYTYVQTPFYRRSLMTPLCHSLTDPCVAQRMGLLKQAVPTVKLAGQVETGPASKFCSRCYSLQTGHVTVPFTFFTWAALLLLSLAVCRPVILPSFHRDGGPSSWNKTTFWPFSLIFYGRIPMWSSSHNLLTSATHNWCSDLSIYLVMVCTYL